MDQLTTQPIQNFTQLPLLTRYKWSIKTATEEEIRLTYDTGIIFFFLVRYDTGMLWTDVMWSMVIDVGLKVYDYVYVYGPITVTIRKRIKNEKKRKEQEIVNCLRINQL